MLIWWIAQSGVKKIPPTVSCPVRKNTSHLPKNHLYYKQKNEQIETQKILNFFIFFLGLLAGITAILINIK